MISFNIPFICGEEENFIHEAIIEKNLSGDGHFTKLCQRELVAFTKASNVLLTSSCTHALELSALLCNIKPGDEVIMSSFTFVSSANAFVLRGAKIVFVDIDPVTMNIDENLIESAITPKTKAILVMHYAGVSCAMDQIMTIAKDNDLFVIEDAAQCIDAYYHHKHLGTIGHLGAFSFHATKNIHCGEGGALLVNDERLINRAEVIREKGTNRKLFTKGKVNKYTWVDIGSSYLLSEISTAFLYAQIQKIKEVTQRRMHFWEIYKKELAFLNPITIKEELKHNAHIFYIKCKDKDQRTDLIEHLKSASIKSAFHYIPLHSSPAGKLFGRFHGEDKYTTKESERLLRFPLYYDLKGIDQVIKSVKQFFQSV